MDEKISKLKQFVEIVSHSNTNKLHEWGINTFKTSLKWSKYIEKMLISTQNLDEVETLQAALNQMEPKVQLDLKERFGARRFLLRSLLTSAFLVSHPRATEMLKLILQEYHCLQGDMKQCSGAASSFLTLDLSTVVQRKAAIGRMVSVLNCINYALNDPDLKFTEYCTSNLEVSVSRRAYASELYGLLCSYVSDPLKLQNLLHEIQTLAKEQDECLEVLAFMMVEPVRHSTIDARDSICCASRYVWDSSRLFDCQQTEMEKNYSILLQSSPMKELAETFCFFLTDARLWGLDGLLLADVAKLYPLVADHYLEFLVKMINQRIGEEISGIFVPSREGFQTTPTIEKHSLKELAWKIQILSKRSSRLDKLCSSILKDHTNIYEHLTVVLKSTSNLLVPQHVPES